NDEIAAFCTQTYNVQFPMFAKISVAGDDQHPLYAALTSAKPDATGDGGLRQLLTSRNIPTNDPPQLLWNFEKFVVGRNGDVVARFAPDVAPTDPRLVAVLDAELAK